MRASQVDVDGRMRAGAGISPLFEQPATANVRHPAAIALIKARMFTLSGTTGI
jgi:hypothetical protein